MATITRIEAIIQTGNKAGAGTNGSVYLGIGGREFHLNSANEAFDDFEQGKERTYVLGESLPSDHTVSDAAHNDPRVDYVLKSEFLDKFPVYIRLDPTGDSPDWNLERATITVRTNVGAVAKYDNLGGFENNLWLGKNFGLYCYLLKQ
jgi:hypothetical protein